MARRAYAGLRPEIAALLRECERQGCRVEHGRHYKIRLPSGKLVVMSNSPSDGRGTKNVRSELRKAGLNI